MNTENTADTVVSISENERETACDLEAVVNTKVCEHIELVKTPMVTVPLVSETD